MSRDNLDESKPTIACAWITCPCGGKHELIPAIETPVYWCGDKLLKLREGDDLEIEELE